MIHSTFKKLEKDLNLRDNGTYVFGFFKNTYVLLSEGQGFKQVNFFFPVKLTDEDTQRIMSWRKKGYAHNIELSDDGVSSAHFTFKELFKPIKLQVLKEVIEDVVSYIYGKYPNETPVCSGTNCHNHTHLEIYNVNGLPMPICPDCAKSIEEKYDLVEAEMQELPNNYFKGFLGACIFALPGIILAVLLFLLGRIAAATGVIIFLMAMKGYTWCKGKFNFIGVLIVALTSVVFTIAGTCLGYIFSLFKSLLTDSEITGYSKWELLKISFSLTEEPEVQKEMLSNVYITLIVCGIFIVWYAIKLLKQTKKPTLTKV